MILGDRGIAVDVRDLERLTELSRRCALFRVVNRDTGRLQEAATAWPITKDLFVTCAVHRGENGGGQLDAGQNVQLVEASLDGGQDGSVREAEVLFTELWPPAQHPELPVTLLRVPGASAEPLPIEATGISDTPGPLLFLPSVLGRLTLRFGGVGPVDETLLFHTVPTETGTGGAPILSTGGRALAVHIGFRQHPHGVETRDGVAFNYGVRISALLDRLAETQPAVLQEILTAHGLATAEEVLSTPEVEPSPLDSVLASAATLWAFDPGRLRASAAEDPGGEGWSLWSRSDTGADDAGGPSWSLKAGVRRDVLASLGRTEAILRARKLQAPFPLSEKASDDREVVPPGARSQQRLLDRVLQGGLSEDDLDSLDELELATATVASEWLRPYVEGVPSTEALEANRARQSLFGPLRELAGDDFAGRVEDLAALEAWVGVDLSKGEGGATEPRGSFVITGQGGVGKSAILAHYLRRLTDRPDPRFPFAVLDFDRPGLMDGDPAAILAELARQLRLQRAAPVEALDELDATIRHTAGVLKAAIATRDEARRVHPDPHDPAVDVAMQSLVATGAEAIATTLRQSTYPTEGPPFVLLLDSYEEVQPCQEAELPGLCSLMGALQEAWPGVRVAVTSRSDVTPLGLKGRAVERHITGLDNAAAQAVLRRREVPPSDQELVLRIARGHPLALRLAADLSLRLAGQGRELTDANLTGELVEGVFYRRILDHLWDKDVEQIAKPGLVLRAVTPSLIQHVLAKPSDLPDVDEARAQALYEQLGAVGALARRDGQVLRHRPDVRRTVLPLLDPGKVAAVDAAAIAYYRGLPTREPWQTAELVYHLLRTAPQSEYEAIWDDTLRPYFNFGDAEELGGAPESWLRARLGGGSGRDLRAMRSEDRHHLHLRTLQAALGRHDRRRVAVAARQLGEISSGPGENYLRCLAALDSGRYGTAIKWATNAMSASADDLLRWKFLLVHAEAAELEGHGDEAEQALQQALSILPTIPELRPDTRDSSNPLRIALLAKLVTVSGQERFIPKIVRGLRQYSVTFGDEGDPNHRPFLRYGATAADREWREPLVLSMRIAGPAQWKRPDVDRLVNTMDEDTLNEAGRFVWAIEKVLDSTRARFDIEEQSVRGRIASAYHALPNAPQYTWRQLSWELEYVRPGVVEAIAKLTERALGPSLYERLRGWESGSQEVVRL